MLCYWKNHVFIIIIPYFFQIKHYSGLNKDKLRWISNISNSVNDILLDVRKLQEPLRLQDDALEQLIDGTNGNLQVRSLFWFIIVEETWTL